MIKPPVDLYRYGAPSAFAWTHSYLIKALTTGKRPIITDPLLIRAFNLIKRGDFAPAEHQALAYTDKEIPLGFREVMLRPSLLARMMQLLKMRPGGKYLEIGSGSGYSAAILGTVASEGKVYTLERIQWLWETTRQNLAKYPKLNNVTALYRDGTSGLLDQVPYDGIIINFALQPGEVETTIETLQQQLKLRTGKLVYASNQYIRVITRHDIDDFEEEIAFSDVLPFGSAGLV